ncbi:hypothetical protein HHK36_021789 [Tetracentron sinense]|uniref:BHLH domain-containing protein n=1 Tax=Tetracentron sinense TaxID=13715 RepID=A0A834YSU2_TETSI|nr:hypothetical protein HHK36_021789 [Tetracentron sinense]
MDSVFFLDEEACGRLLRSVAQAFGCTYICLWSYNSHPANYFISKDCWYMDENNQPSSSSGSLARRLFDEYQRSLFINVGNDHVPGLAFHKDLPYLELKELDLIRQASTETQRQFYQEAKIKTAAFMGCKRGEIELGMSTLSQINIETGMRNWFSEMFSQQSQFRELPRLPDQNRPSSSSSKSLSMDSPEYSSLLFNPASSTTSYMPEFLKEAPIEQAIRPASTSIMSHQQAMQPYDPFCNIQFRNLERDEAVITRAMLAVISSPSSSSSSYRRQQIRPHNYQVNQRTRTSAFKTYSSPLAPTAQTNTNLVRLNMLKRAVTFFKGINLMRIQEQLPGTRPTSMQLHHMISERKRREKLNDSFQALRSLLPPGSKKDKASVLSSTRDYLSSLKAQVFELDQKNKQLEALLSPAKETSEEANINDSSSRRVDVRVTTSESTCEERNINLLVTVRGDCVVLNLVIRILEFLKQIKDISLVSMEADTQLQQSNSFNRAIFRLKIKGSEWDESAFQEAMTRVVADISH